MFQNSILGCSGLGVDENVNSDSSDDCPENEDEDQKLEKGPEVAVELKADNDNERVRVSMTNIPLVSYAPKASESSTLAGKETLSGYTINHGA